MITLVAGDLATLDREVEKIRGLAYADGTKANLNSQWKNYFTFCTTFNLQAIPATVTTLCRYIAYLCRSLKSYQSIKNYLHGVSVLHKHHDAPFVGLSNYNIRLMLQSVRKNLGNTPLAKLPIELWMLSAFSQCLNLSVPKDAAFFSALLIAFFGFLRKSNVVPASAETFDPRRHLSRGNIICTPDSLTLCLQLTKTQQNRDASSTIAISAFDHALNPVAVYLNYTKLVPAPDTAPAFVFTDTYSRLTSFTHSAFVQRLKELLGIIGVDPKQYSGHSLRRGGCSLAYRAGVGKELLQHHGTWRSDCYQRYIDFSPQQQLSVTRAMGDMCNSI